MTYMYKFVVNTLKHRAKLSDNNIEIEKIYKIILDFIVYFDGIYVIIWKCFIPPQSKLIFFSLI